MTIDKYSYNQYTQIQTINVEIPHLGKRNGRFEKIFLLDNHFVMFTSHHDPADDINYAYASLINLKGEFIKDPIEVDRIESVKSKKNPGSFQFSLSPDSTYLLAFHNTPFEPLTNDKFSVRLFDDELNAIWSNKFKLPYDDGNFEVVNVLLDNNQNVYMVCAQYGNELLQSDQTLNKGYSLLHYNHQEKKLTEFEIKVENKWFHSAHFKIVADTSLVVAGFYSNSGQGNMAGIFYLRFNTTNDELESSGFEPLPREVITAIGASGDFSFNSGTDLFTLRNLLVQPDTRVVLVAEKEYVDVSTYIDPYTGQHIRNNHYHFDEVLVVGISNQAKIDFATVIQKYQNSTNDGGPYSSIAVNLHKGMVYVLYNDNPSNLTLKNDFRALTSFGKSIAMVARINEKGEISKEPLFSTKDFGGILKPKFSRESNSAQQVIYGEQNGKDKFGEILYLP